MRCISECSRLFGAVRRTAITATATASAFAPEPTISAATAANAGHHGQPGGGTCKGLCRGGVGIDGIIFTNTCTPYG